MKQRRTNRQAPAPAEWFSGVRYRALAYVLAIALAAAATIVVAGGAWVPIVGVAVAAAGVAMGKVTTRLTKPTCLSCGHDLSGEPIGVHGIACPSCGGVRMPGLVELARMGKGASVMPEGDDEGDVEG